MLTQAVKIDDNGMFIEDVLIDATERVLPPNIVTIPVPDGLFHPKWDGEKWIEGMSQKEIDEILNRPKPIQFEEIIGNQIVTLELENYMLKQQNDYLGSQLVDLELRILQLEGGNN